MKAIFVGGKLNGCIIDTDEVIKQKLLKCRGYTKDLTIQRIFGESAHREELDNQPKFEGYIGPMWDGDKLRYETQSVYDLMTI